MGIRPATLWSPAQLPFRGFVLHELQASADVADVRMIAERLDDPAADG
jgi:hypothetical protein